MRRNLFLLPFILRGRDQRREVLFLVKHSAPLSSSSYQSRSLSHAVSFSSAELLELCSLVITSKLYTNPSTFQIFSSLSCFSLKFVSALAKVIKPHHHWRKLAGFRLQHVSCSVRVKNVMWTGNMLFKDMGNLDIKSFWGLISSVCNRGRGGGG